MTAINLTQGSNETETETENEYEHITGTLANPHAERMTEEVEMATESEAEQTPVYVTLLSDTMGRRPINIQPLREAVQNVTLTVRNVLGYAQVELGSTALIFLNNALATLDSTVAEGDQIYVAGKLAGGSEDENVEEENAMNDETNITEDTAEHTAEHTAESIAIDAADCAGEIPAGIYVTLLSDTMGSRPLNIRPLQEGIRSVSLTVRNILGYAQVEPGSSAQIFVNNVVGSLDSVVAEGDLIYVAGKLAGGTENDHGQEENAMPGATDIADEVDGETAVSDEMTGHTNPTVGMTAAIEDEDNETAQEPPVYVTLLSDTQGSRPINIQPLQMTLPGHTLTIRNVLGYAQAEPGATAQLFLNNAVASLDSAITEGDMIYVAGKLAGGS
jgi:hypothetical protein